MSIPHEYVKPLDLVDKHEDRATRRGNLIPLVALKARTPAPQDTELLRIQSVTFHLADTIATNPLTPARQHQSVPKSLLRPHSHFRTDEVIQTETLSLCWFAKLQPEVRTASHLTSPNGTYPKR